ncbi:MAG: MFS transporter, partial [Mycobacterium sp.]
GLATGLSVSPCTDLIMDAFPPHLLGVGGAVNDTSLELGGSMGIAVLGSVLATGYTNNITAAVPAALPPEQADVIKESIGGALAAADHLAATGAHVPAAQLQTSAFEAFSNALSHSSLIGAIVLGIGTVIVGALLPSRRHHQQLPEQRRDDQMVETGAVR